MSGQVPGKVAGPAGARSLGKAGQGPGKKQGWGKVGAGKVTSCLATLPRTCSSLALVDYQVPLKLYFSSVIVL